MTRFTVILGFVIAFGAGMAVGRKSHRPDEPSAHGRTGHGSGLTAELNLSAQQQEQLDRIWSAPALQARHQRDEQRHELYRQRDQAVVGLVRPEDKSKYDQIVKECDEKVAALDAQAKAVFQAAVEQTRAVLTPEQAGRYDKLLERRQAEHGSRDRRHGGGWHKDHAASGAASAAE